MCRSVWGVASERLALLEHHVDAHHRRDDQPARIAVRRHRLPDFEHVVVGARKELAAQAGPLFCDPRQLLALRRAERELPTGPLALERADRVVPFVQHVERAADREQFLLEAADFGATAVFHFHRGEEE